MCPGETRPRSPASVAQRPGAMDDLLQSGVGLESQGLRLPLGTKGQTSVLGALDALAEEADGAVEFRPFHWLVLRGTEPGPRRRGRPQLAARTKTERSRKGGHVGDDAESPEKSTGRRVGCGFTHPDTAQGGEGQRSSLLERCERNTRRCSVEKRLTMTQVGEAVLLLLAPWASSLLLVG